MGSESLMGFPGDEEEGSKLDSEMEAAADEGFGLRRIWRLLGW